MSWISVKSKEKPSEYKNVLVYAPYMDFIAVGYFNGSYSSYGTKMKEFVIRI